MNKKFSVIILNYNTWQDTLEEIKLIDKILGETNIIVVDNCSPNESYEMLDKNNNGRYTLIKADSNAGYASGNNIGMRYAYNHGYEYAWILNNDIIFEDSAIVDKMLKVFEDSSDIAVVNPDVYAPDGYLFNRDSIRPSFYDLTIGMYSYKKKGRVVEDKGGYGYVYRPQGCCMLVDLKKMQEVDYMDERTFLYSEEIILAERLLKSGYKCACCTDTSIIHNHSTTVKKSIDKKKIYKIQMESFRYYLEKYRNYKNIKRNICCWFYYMKLRLLG